MHAAPLPLTRDLVLIGGGHTHALVLRKWGMKPIPGVRLTLINPGPTAPYSGMLPGFVAGHYSRDALDIDLVKLARFADARLILGAATAIDPITKTISIQDHPDIGYDVAAIDIGITSDMPSLLGFGDHAVPAKPLGPFASRWEAYLNSDQDSDVAVIGGGVAGVELAMAIAFALREAKKSAQVTVIERETALSALRPAAARKLRKAAIGLGVRILEGTDITHLSDGHVHFGVGSQQAFGFITGAAGAKPYAWLSQSGLAHENGFLTVDDRLQTSDPSVFAVGDCAHLAFDPRPKAGVYAVRQAPVLLSNLRAAVAGGPVRRYRPQKDYLKLISLGGKAALGDRLGMAFSGEWAWGWKDRIDRKFMDQFRHLPAMPKPVLPHPRAKGVSEAVGDKPMCGGCGAKLGRDVLGAALAELPAPVRTDVTPLPYDDAALLTTGGVQQVMTTDHLRSFWPDPAVMARIATLHALGDIWAMGATPQAATLNITLPRQSDALAARMMAEIITPCADALRNAGAEIVGGHSTFGDELTIGLAITGLCDSDPITLSGAKPGDVLILTKPLGSGVIMAAEMQGKAKGHWVASALDAMQQSQGGASDILAPYAHAMTDVTGFGLAGHVQNICAASGVAAEVQMDAVPLMQGALELSKSGINSSLFGKNRQEFDKISEGYDSDLLFDPQTSGGLMAAVSASDAGAIIAALNAAGYDHARVMGRITDGTAGQVSLA